MIKMKRNLWTILVVIAFVAIVLQLFFILVAGVKRLGSIEERLTGIETTLSEWGLDE